MLSLKVFFNYSQRAGTPVGRGRPGAAAPQNNKSATTANAGSNYTAFERHAAAAKLAAAYSGRLGRKEAEQERRKLEAERRQQHEAEEEANRPKAREIKRPKGRSYIGF